MQSEIQECSLDKLMTLPTNREKGHGRSAFDYQ